MIEQKLPHHVIYAFFGKDWRSYFSGKKRKVDVFTEKHKIALSWRKINLSPLFDQICYH